MRELRFVRLSEDGSHLVVAAPDDGEHFGLPVGPTLRAAVVAEQQPADAPVDTGTAPAAPADSPAVPAAASAPAAPAPLVPRDVQMRVRGGESPEDVAASLGVELDRVMRFAMPVIDERRRIAEEARRSRARHTAPEGVDSKVVVFGEAVNARYAAHGIDPFAVEWDSFRRPDGEWVVVASWLGGESRHQAQWVFHRTSRTVTPIDDTAADLLSDRPIRPVAPPPPPRLVVAPPLAPGVVAFPPMPDAHTGRIPRIEEEVFDQEAPAEPLPPALRPALVRDEPARLRGEHPDTRSEAPATPDAGDTVPVDFDTPPLPLGIAEPAPRPEAPVRRARREVSEDDRAARARIPSWDDILLGVRRKSD